MIERDEVGAFGCVAALVTLAVYVFIGWWLVCRVWPWLLMVLRANGVKGL